MATSTTPLTIDDYERLPAEVAEHHELVDGELVPVPGNTPEHSDLRFETRRTLQDFVLAHHLGRVTDEQEFDFQGNTHAPDVSFFGNDKVPLVERRKRVQRFVPDLAIEIESESDSGAALVRKKNRYLRSGVREVWLISTEGREIRVYTQTTSRLLTGSAAITTDLLPGFSISVEELLRGL
jgi:Uma2 family endonuclease